jgi:hypothetical protein
MDDDLLLLNNLLVSQHLLTIHKESKAQDRLQLLAATVLIIGSNEDHMWVMRNHCHRHQYLG